MKIQQRAKSTPPTQPVPGPQECGEISQPIAFLDDLIDRYGDVVRYPTSYGPFYLVNHPNDVEHVLHSTNFHRSSLVKIMLGEGLLASDGDYWRQQRRVMQPGFRADVVARYVLDMLEEIARTRDRWREVDKDQVVDISRAMTQMTLGLSVQTLFSERLSFESATPLCDALDFIIDDLGQISRGTLGPPPSLSPTRNADFTKNKGMIDEFCLDVIARHRRQDNPPDDFLTTLLTSTDRGTGNPYTDEQLRDEMVTMLIGGHETTGDRQHREVDLAEVFAAEVEGGPVVVERRMLEKLLP